MGQACRADIWSKVGVFAKYAENGNGKRNPSAEKKSAQQYLTPYLMDSISIISESPIKKSYLGSS